MNPFAGPRLLAPLALLTLPWLFETAAHSLLAAHWAASSPRALVLLYACSGSVAIAWTLGLEARYRRGHDPRLLGPLRWLCALALALASLCAALAAGNLIYTHGDEDDFVTPLGIWPMLVASHALARRLAVRRGFAPAPIAVAGAGHLLLVLAMELGSSDIPGYIAFAAIPLALLWASFDWLRGLFRPLSTRLLLTLMGLPLIGCGHGSPRAIVRYAPRATWAGALEPAALDSHLGLNARPVVLEHCSRSSPPADGSWQPNARCMAGLERALPAVLAALPNDAQPPSGRYGRQYAPFLDHGRRYVYINGYRIEHDFYNATPAPVSHAIDVCDGGQAFFGLVYDVARSAFVGYESNGPDGSSLALALSTDADCSGAGDTLWEAECNARDRDRASEPPDSADPCAWYCPPLADVLAETEPRRIERHMLRLTRCFQNMCAQAEAAAHLGAARVRLGKLKEAREAFAQALVCSRSFDLRHASFQDPEVRRELCAVMAGEPLSDERYCQNTARGAGP